MPVYVDNARNAFGRMVMSHLIGDTEPELHAMAERIGLKRAWFQKATTSAKTPHYDLCQEKRLAAIREGAIEIDRRQTVALIRKLRAQRGIQQGDQK